MLLLKRQVQIFTGKFLFTTITYQEKFSDLIVPLLQIKKLLQKMQQLF